MGDFFYLGALGDCISCSSIQPALVMNMFNGTSEIPMTVAKLPVFYKQRDLLFYPSWAYALPLWILKIPISLIEVGVWVFMTYYVIGFDPSVGRYMLNYNEADMHLEICLASVSIVQLQVVKAMPSAICSNSNGFCAIPISCGVGRNMIVSLLLTSLRFSYCSCLLH